MTREMRDTRTQLAQQNSVLEHTVSQERIIREGELQLTAKIERLEVECKQLRHERDSIEISYE